MALPTTGVETTVEVIGELISKPYIEITLRLMARFGVEVQREGWQRFIIPGGKPYVSPGTLYVEGDASSASYFLAAGAIGGSTWAASQRLASSEETIADEAKSTVGGK